jgi:hypothetical protein
VGAECTIQKIGTHTERPAGTQSANGCSTKRHPTALEIAETQGPAATGPQGNAGSTGGNLLHMKTRSYRTAEAARLAADLQACIETYVDLGSAELTAIPETDWAEALSGGLVAGINPVLGHYCAALIAARDEDYLAALSALRRAFDMGFDPSRSGNILNLIHRGIAAELQVPGFSEKVFSTAALADARYVEVRVNEPLARVCGLETEIVTFEQRPTAELQEVFAGQVLDGMPTSYAAAEATAETLLLNAGNTALAPQERAAAHVCLGAIALKADELRTAVRLVAAAVRLAPEDELTSTAAVFLWLVVAAAGREKKLTGEHCPRWLDVVTLLRATLAYEVRHAANRGTREVIL